MIPLSKQKLLFIVLLIALVVTRLIAVWPHISTQLLDVPTDWRKLSGDAVTYDMPAYHLLAGHGYSSALVPPYEPSVLRTPTYPLVLAATYAIFGRTEAAVMGLNVLCDMITALLLFDIARRKFPFGWAIGYLATVVVLAPWSDFVDQRLSESLASMLVSLVLWQQMRPPNHKRWFVLGLCTGVLLLCRPAFALLPFVIACWVIFIAKTPAPRQRTWYVAALLAGVVTLWSPWIVRNAAVTGRFVPLSVGSGLSLWVGTWYEKPPFWHIKESENGYVEREIPAVAFVSMEERDRVLPLFNRYIELYFSNGGIRIREPDQLLGQVAREKIRDDPWRWLSLRTRMTVKMLKQRYFGVRAIKSGTLWLVVQWAIGVLAIVGAIISKRQKDWQPATIIFLYTALVHFPTHGETRYFTPAYGAVMLLAALAVHVIARSMRNCWERRKPGMGTKSAITSII